MSHPHASAPRSQLDYLSSDAVRMLARRRAEAPVEATERHGGSAEPVGLGLPPAVIRTARPPLQIVRPTPPVTREAGPIRVKVQRTLYGAFRFVASDRTTGEVWLELKLPRCLARRGLSDEILRWLRREIAAQARERGIDPKRVPSLTLLRRLLEEHS